MLTLGIDPGTATTGFGVVRQTEKGLLHIVNGCIKTSPKNSAESRLALIFRQVSELIKRYQPDYLAVERLFFGRNTTTAMAVGQARGMILLAAAQNKVALSEYTPLEVKMALTGYGRADKKQVQIMVKTLLKLPGLPKPDDAADALAIAICHLHSFRLKEGLLT
ncbi:MAG: crossover junction endodeoxyribonuclease RuvC [Candidatus Margulisbacteria bacterium]|nr:crossover junction endodeoxyribonuclease RuvC [Candidatus Margulisiibacteriota bacterium]MBU1617087.1 crossover junction endodeoxyribonuclease RuvC [Candidatus Margulisiibacteriota bacterium]MBU1866924.1 crossover junction endodeoxyribonuclease RuvC [Candidatus Margulisiibacteriota bacterium]